MHSRKILGAASVATSLFLGGCSGEMAVNSVVSASPELLRDCDRLGMKVLLASYEKAGENQGRLIEFMSSTEIPLKGKKFNNFGYKPKGDGWIDSYGGVLLHGRTYYVDENGSPQEYATNSKSEKPPEIVLTIDTTSQIKDGKDRRESVKTKDSLTCILYFGGNGVAQGYYKVSEDNNSIYWVQV